MMTLLRKRLAERRRRGLPATLPHWLKSLGRFVGGAALERDLWAATYRDILAAARPRALQTDVTLGIIQDRMLSHAYYEAACIELGVPYHLIDITSAQWIDDVRNAGCGCYLARPFVLTERGRRVYDDRLRILCDGLRQRLYPDLASLWLFESKYRQADWLEAHRIPHPQTWVFHRREEAESFAASATLPVVFKTDMGAEASGVRVIRTRAELAAVTRTCFGYGFRRRRAPLDERQRGTMLLQEFIPNAREWRVICIGESWFAREKGRIGDYHSGTKIALWTRPPRALMDMCYRTAQAGAFRSMCMDVFEDTAGRYLVNELHAYFGLKHQHAMILDGRPGRYSYSPEADSWCFEEGDFCRNNLCNLRVEYVLNSYLDHAG